MNKKRLIVFCISAAILLLIASLFLSFADLGLILLVGMTPIIFSQLRRYWRELFWLGLTLLVIVIAITTVVLFLFLPMGSAPSPAPPFPAPQCKRFYMNLFFDPRTRAHSGTQTITLIYEGMDLDEVPKIGQPVRVLAGRATNKFLILDNPWIVTNVSVITDSESKEIGGSNHQKRFGREIFPKVELTLINTRISIETSRLGICTYGSEVRLPRQITFSEGQESTKIELILTIPQNTYVKHNLQGTFQESVLEDNRIGQRLVANDLLDSETVLRLNYNCSLLQNEAGHSVTEFSWLTVFFMICSILLGTLGYLLGVAVGVFKDVAIIPLANRLMTKIGLIEK